MKGNRRGDAHVLTIGEGEYPVEFAFVLRPLREAMAEEDVRRTMEGEDLLLQDSILLARQAERHERRAEQAERAQEQAERERRLLLAQAIRRLHGLGQDAEAIAASLAADAEEVRRVLSR